MNATRLCMMLLILALATPLFAMADHNSEIIYYDAYGNEIGHTWVVCGPHPTTHEGGYSDIWVEIVGLECYTLEPITCQDVGLEPLNPSNCGNSWCTSVGYVEAYEDCMVPDCGDVYKTGCPARSPAAKKQLIRRAALELSHVLARILTQI